MKKNRPIYVVLGVAAILMIVALLINKNYSGNCSQMKKRVAYKPIFYKEAVSLIEKKDYEAAISYLLELGDYRNADELLLHSIEELNKYENTIDEENWEERLKQAKIDEIVYFGECEINGISDDKEKIPWRVIYKEGNKTLIISESVLTVVPFCGQRSSGVNWVNSFLRKWLNEDFYTKSFSNEEKSLISITEIDSSNEYSSQEVTNDNVFVLSVDELEKYLNESNIGGHPTVAVRLTYDNQISENDMISYWTRTMMPNNVFVVDDNNSFMDISGKDDRGVRPALWLEFSD